MNTEDREKEGQVEAGKEGQMKIKGRSIRGIFPFHILRVCDKGNGGRVKT